VLKAGQCGEVREFVADAAYDSNAIRQLGKQLKAKLSIKLNRR
jgi:hypothetical protein